MSYRVVIPRSVPFADSNRVQQAIWKQGYGTRLAGRDTAAPDHLVVQFLRTVDQLPEPEEVDGYEQALEAALAGGRVATTFTGHGAWLETVQPAPRVRRTPSAR